MSTAQTNVNGLSLMEARLKHRSQQDRMIEGKLKSLKDATKYSYQGARIQHLGISQVDPALINPDTTRMSYDDKILSVDNKFEYKVGEVFEWLNTSTKWLIYLQDLTELAYFKGKIRKCNYTIKWEDEDGDTQSTYAAVQGPLANQIESSIKMNGNISLDMPNYQLTILMPKTDETTTYFKRYSKFYLNGLTDNTCWRIIGADTISTEGIIQIIAEEYYANKDEDDLTNGIVGALIVKHIDDDTDYITGPDYIKPKQEYSYAFKGEIAGDWAIESNKPITYTIVDNRNITLKWNSTYKGTFQISNGNVVKTVTVESLF